jgi:hypothetical protein
MDLHGKNRRSCNALGFRRYSAGGVCTMVALIGLCAIAARANVVIETVTVGNPGNVGELSGAGAGGYGPERICGEVGYTYQIGKLEITAAQRTREGIPAGMGTGRSVKKSKGQNVKSEDMETTPMKVRARTDSRTMDARTRERIPAGTRARQDSRTAGLREPRGR